MPQEYIISDDLTLRFAAIPSRFGVCHYLAFDILFTSFKALSYPYYVELWTEDAFFEALVSRRSMSLHDKYLVEDAITAARVQALITYLVEKITSYHTRPFVGAGLMPDLLFREANNLEYTEPMIFHVRNFLVNIDTFVKYDGYCLENYSYDLMRDYMDRFDVNFEITGVAPLSMEGIWRLGLEPYLPGATRPVGEAQLFVVLEDVLWQQRKNLIRSVVGDEIFEVRKCIICTDYEEAEIHRRVRLLVNGATEAIPAPLFSNHLSMYFDVVKYR